MQQDVCAVHAGQSNVFLCLKETCEQDRLGCEKCLLKLHTNHLKCCVFIKDLKEGNHKLYSNDVDDISLEEFTLNELVHKQKIPQIVAEFQDNFLAEVQIIKKYVAQKEAENRTKSSIKAKQLLHQYRNIFEMRELKVALQKFKDNEMDEQQIDNIITQIIDQRSELENKIQQKKFVTLAKCLHPEIRKSIISGICELIDSIKFLIKKQDSFPFIKSALSKEDDNNMIERVVGKQFDFNANDEISLIYGVSQLTSGVIEWQIKIEYLKEDDDTKQLEGLDSLIQNNGVVNIASQHPIGGHLNNTGVMSAPEYKYLGRLYVGVVDDNSKDLVPTYSINYQSNQCLAVDVVRGTSQGQFYSKQHVQTEKLDAIQNVFKRLMHTGIVLCMKVDLTQNKITLSDSEKTCRYEGVLSGMSTDNLKPFILGYKCRVRVTIN